MHDIVKGVAQGGVDVGKFTDFPAGTLGGEFRCGETSLQGMQTTVCVWADQGSLAGVMVYDEGLDTAVDLARQVREAVEHRTS
jgi:hypothetical protein